MLLLTAFFAGLILAIPHVAGFTSTGAVASTSRDWVTLLFGLFGASIGAIVAYFIHVRLKRDQTRANAFSSLIRAQAVVNDLYGLKMTIEELIAESDKAGLRDNPVWLKVHPIAGVPHTVSFPPEELVFLAEVKQYDLMQDLLLMGSRHVAVVDTVLTYNKLRLEIRDLLPVHAVRGNRFHGTMSEEQRNQIAPRMVELDSLLGKLITNLDAYIKHGAATLSAVSQAGKTIFGEKNFPKVGVEALRSQK